MSRCQEMLPEHKNKIPKEFGMNRFNVFQHFTLLRITNGSLYYDWPWKRDRLDEPKSAWVTLMKDHYNLLEMLLSKVSDFPDSVFFMGGERPYLPWNFPFPAFSNAPSLTYTDMPWPWFESIKSELDMHKAMFPQHVTKSRKLLLLVVDPYRQVFFDQSRMAPEQLKVIFSFHPNCHIKPTNPDSPEKEISLKDVEKFSKEEIEKAGRDKEAYPAGYALPLLTVGGPSGGHYNPAEFKYVIVTLGSYGRSTSGRLAGIIAHSGAVVMLEKTPFFYHFSARMQPWVHYVPISYSMADIVEKVKWLQQHDDLAQRIVINAKHFARSYLRMEDYYCYAATSLETLGQIMIKSDVLQPFNPIKLYSGYPGYSS